MRNHEIITSCRKSTISSYTRVQIYRAAYSG